MNVSEFIINCFQFKILENLFFKNLLLDFFLYSLTFSFFTKFPLFLAFKYGLENGEKSGNFEMDIEWQPWKGTAKILNQYVSSY